MYEKLSIDKIVILGHSTINLESWITNRSNTAIIKHEQAKLPYDTNYFMVDKTFLQLGIKKSGESRTIRLVYNPNKSIKEIPDAILGMIQFDRISRLDIAVDFYGRDLSLTKWYEPRSRKRVMYLSGSGALQTLYIGSRESNLMWRIYDKAKQLKKSPAELMWRVEAEVKFDKGESINMENFNPFEQLKGTQELNINLDYAWGDIAHLEYLDRNRELLPTLHARTRAKYKKLFVQQSRLLDPQPTEVWTRDKNEILTIIRNQLNICDLASSHL